MAHNTYASYYITASNSNGESSPSNTDVATTIDTTTHTGNKFYVDKNAPGSSTGTSWTNAWKSFSSINWSAIDPGDILYISGGTDSTVYTEQLVIGASGTSGNHVIVRSGLTAGHNGKVIINTNFSIKYSIVLNTRSYVEVRDIFIRNANEGVHIQLSNYVVLDSITVDQWAYSGSDDQVSGIYVDGYTAGTDSTFLLNCHITLTDTLVKQTDGYVIRYATNTFMDNCYGYLDNRDYLSGGDNHNDVVQWYATTGAVQNVTISNSFLCNMTQYIGGKGGQSQIIMAQNTTGTVVIYNTIFYGPNYTEKSGGGMGVINYYNDAAQWNIVHNTFFGKSTESLINCFSASNNAIILKNNIFYSINNPVRTGTYRAPMYLGCGVANLNQIDGNLFSPNACLLGSNDVMSVSGRGSLTMAQIYSGGGEQTGGYTTRDRVDPLFTGGVDFTLQGGSPAKNNGANLQSLIEGFGLEWKDKNGVSRDSSPSCGAYE